MADDRDRSGHFDVLIIGAGLSGIGAAYQLQSELPGKTYALLESRESMGGTWDFFNYPGFRSDTDMQTLGYRFRPWTEGKAVAANLKGFESGFAAVSGAGAETGAWGGPLASGQSAGKNMTVGLSGASGRHFLIWITDLNGVEAAEIFGAQLQS